MSVEADFGISEWVYQASGSQVAWDITWPGVLDDGRFVAVSFQSDFDKSQLTRISESFSTEGLTNHVGETIRATSRLGGGVAFRFAVVVMPNS